jgi:hypothetical protein
VNEELSLLIALQKLDTVILAGRLKIDAIPNRIFAEEGPLKDAEAAFDKAKQRHLSLEKKKKEKETAIEDINEKVKKHKQRSSDIKNNKEYQALLAEIEKVQKQTRDIEDELLVIMESLEESARLLTVEKTRIEAEKAEVDVHRAKLEVEAKTLRDELDLLKKDRADLVSRLEGGTYNLYMNILKHGRGMAVVEARDELCMGCNLHIPPQMFVELKNNNEVTHCPQCRRILYYVKQEGPSSTDESSGQLPEGNSMKGFITENSRH